MYPRLTHFVSNWLIPPGYANLLRRGKITLQHKLRRSNENSLLKTYKSRLESFRNRERGRRCFILASGPSIGKQDISILRDEVCIGVSFFFLHPQAAAIKPQYHIFAPNHPPFDFDLPKRYINGIKNAYNHQFSAFYGWTPYEFSILNYAKEIENLPPNLEVIDYSQSEYINESNAETDKSWTLDKKPFKIRTVLYSGIQLARHLGCTEIYLVGCDHDYLAERQRTENHFYKDIVGNPQELNHIDTFSTEKWFLEYYNRWHDFRLMQSALLKKDIKIFNATNGGMLDVFKRTSLEELFSKGNSGCSQEDKGTE